MSEQLEVKLPTTTEALDAFVASLCEEYALPVNDDTYDAIATMILHLPQTKYLASREYFGHGVLKSIANKVAYDKLTEFRIAREAKEKAEEQEKLMSVNELVLPCNAHAPAPVEFKSAAEPAIEQAI